MGQSTSNNNNNLERKLTFVHLFMIIVATMVGSGIFTTSGFIMQNLKSPLAMLLCWLIGGLLALTGALCYGELGAMFPAAGGDYIFLRESFPSSTYASLMFSWASLLSTCSTRRLSSSAPAPATAVKGRPRILAALLYIIASRASGVNGRSS